MIRALLSIAIRIPLIGIVLFFGFWFGIPVAMGFDAGYSLGAFLIASAYLITFGPALLLLLAPTSVIFRPPLLVKIWYGWVALLGLLWVIAWLYLSATTLTKGASRLLDQVLLKDKYGTVCWKLLDNDPTHFANIGIGYESAMQFTARPAMYCHTVEVSKGQLKFFYGGGINPAMDVPIVGGGKTCVGISPLYRESSENITAWSAKLIDCAPTNQSTRPARNAGR